ncbi:LOW QUALITY PROTEIN: hypothetical protein ACO22_04596 [Paracoccidioides brasiliensis]|uniref:Uncharacterized protein n=1 Tax=Paracoccidioides brasiliensis TaxID=121759 RepID=A0A1D2JCZ7_PARBR|nr:LOW QUALITY PROTEIN: hypothetical protein ACO22_04596 [Paracoccidioides brasiliensis]
MTCVLRVIDVRYLLPQRVAFRATLNSGSLAKASSSNVDNESKTNTASSPRTRRWAGYHVASRLEKFDKEYSSSVIQLIALAVVHQRHSENVQRNVPKYTIPSEVPMHFIARSCVAQISGPGRKFDGAAPDMNNRNPNPSLNPLQVMRAKQYLGRTKHPYAYHGQSQG